MKKSALLVVAVFGSLSFNAFAGGDCQFGHPPKVAIADETPELINSEVTDPRFIALLHEQEQQKEQSLEALITYN